MRSDVYEIWIFWYLPTQYALTLQMDDEISLKGPIGVHLVEIESKNFSIMSWAERSLDKMT